MKRFSVLCLAPLLTIAASSFAQGTPPGEMPCMEIQSQPGHYLCNVPGTGWSNCVVVGGNTICVAAQDSAPCPAAGPAFCAG